MDSGKSLQVISNKTEMKEEIMVLIKGADIASLNDYVNNGVLLQTPSGYDCTSQLNFNSRLCRSETDLGA